MVRKRRHGALRQINDNASRTMPWRPAAGIAPPQRLDRAQACRGVLA
jgi:hypothetical protein